jgi:hypothetical protein
MSERLSPVGSIIHSRQCSGKKKRPIQKAQLIANLNTAEILAKTSVMAANMIFGYSSTVALSFHPILAFWQILAIRD